MAHEKSKVKPPPPPQRSLTPRNVRAPTPARLAQRTSASPACQPAPKQAGPQTETYTRSPLEQATPPFVAVSPGTSLPAQQIADESALRRKPSLLPMGVGFATTLAAAGIALFFTLGPNNPIEASTAAAKPPEAQPIKTEAMAPANAPATKTPAPKDPAGSIGAAAKDSPSFERGEDDGSHRSAPNCPEALGHAEIAVSDDPKELKATLSEAARALRHGNVKGAQAVFCKAVAMAPNSFWAHLGLAQTLLIRRDAQATADWARKATALPSEYPRRAKNLLGDALSRLGQIPEARDLWYEAGPIPNPTDEQLEHYMRKTQERAASALGAYDYHRAERLYRRVLIFEPGNHVARRRLVTALRRLEQYKAAEYWANISL